MLWILFWGAFICAVIYQIRLNSKNKYVLKHKQYLKNERLYEDYLRWCESKVQIPMDKEIYIREIESKNSKIKDLLR